MVEWFTAFAAVVGIFAVGLGIAWLVGELYERIGPFKTMGGFVVVVAAVVATIAVL